MQESAAKVGIFDTNGCKTWQVLNEREGPELSRNGRDYC